MSLRLSESLHQAARALAEREGISVNQLVATALAEKLAALMTVEYIERAGRGNRGRFLAAMAKVPNAEPEPWDRLPVSIAPQKRVRPANARQKARRGKRSKK
ncbi:MAG TPA: toxin-antitoxin system HicB family antitoxin [Gemmatimonadaceae bacterium]|nr:toxin-antitoxin system HicB family antitoxin [Gemmatimonadaceae bacterium]